MEKQGNGLRPLTDRRQV